jgi:hypothetical protein
MSARPAPWKSAQADAHEAMAEALETAVLALHEVRDAVQPLLRPKVEQMISELLHELHENERAAREARAEA